MSKGIFSGVTARIFWRGDAQGDAVPPLQTVIGFDGTFIDRHPLFRYPRLDEGTGPFSLRRYEFVHPLTGPCIFHLPLVRLFPFRQLTVRPQPRLLAARPILPVSPRECVQQQQPDPDHDARICHVENGEMDEAKIEKVDDFPLKQSVDKLPTAPPR